MAPRTNPLKLNPLQLRTLTLFQAVAQLPDATRPGSAEGSVRLLHLPHAHGDHFHLGDAVVSAKDATGLANPSVWQALTRKGLIAEATFPRGLELTAAGLAYDTGLGDTLLYHAPH
ncbi:MAG: hypothetical protein RIE31_00950 [Alphaproteobacteria bacterium]